MIVLSITNCPQSLKGDITKWLFEVSAGVYAGRVSARVRELLWDRVVKSAKSGSATMVWSANNEQGLDFRVHNCDWEPIDFDGLKLMMRPSIRRMEHRSKPITRPGTAYFARRKGRVSSKPDVEEYAVVDICADDDIIKETAAIRVRQGSIVSQYSGDVPGLFEYIGELETVTHSKELLKTACESAGKMNFDNKIVDSYKLAARELYNLKSHSIDEVAEYMGIKRQGENICLANCYVLYEIYKRLLE